MNLDAIERMVAARLDTSIVCPHCGHVEDGSECEMAEQVVSYWGEEVHKVWCSDCDKEFLVREHVTRTFETAKSADDFE